MVGMMMMRATVLLLMSFHIHINIHTKTPNMRFFFLILYQVKMLVVYKRNGHFRSKMIIFVTFMNFQNVYFHCSTRSAVIQWAIRQGWAGMTFWHLGTGTGMAQPIPKLWEREREWKIAFPTFGNGNGNENSIPNFWEREREWKFHSRILGTGIRRCYSWEWLGTGTGMASENWVNIFPNPTF